MPIMGTCKTCGGETLDYCCVACMSIEIRELQERELQRKAKVERLQKFAKTEYQRGREEGSSCQAILEIQGRERFVEELKADGCPRCPHKEEVERLQTVVADLESKCQSLALANDFQCSEIRRLTALLVSRGKEA